MQSMNPISTIPVVESVGAALATSADDRIVDLRFGVRYAASVAQEALAEVAAQVAEVFALFMEPGAVVTLGPGVEIEHGVDVDGEPTVRVNGVIMNRYESHASAPRTANLEALNFLREVLDPIAPPIAVTRHAPAER